MLDSHPQLKGRLTTSPDAWLGATLEAYGGRAGAALKDATWNGMLRHSLLRCRRYFSPMQNRNQQYYAYVSAAKCRERILTSGIEKWQVELHFCRAQCARSTCQALENGFGNIGKQRTCNCF